jgi:hypothetical protein
MHKTPTNNFNRPHLKTAQCCRFRSATATVKNSI